MSVGTSTDYPCGKSALTCSQYVTCEECKAAALITVTKEELVARLAQMEYIDSLTVEYVWECIERGK